jgi:hypothetical protein
MATTSGQPGLRLNRDVVAGVALAVIGATLLVLNRNYPLGTMHQPGPGFMPTGVAIALVLLGAAVAMRGALVARYHAGIERIRPRSFIAVLGVALFGFLIQHLGFAICASLLLAAAVAAGDRLRWLDLLGFVLVLVPLCALVFIKGLGQLVPIWPW